jgi:hypothetical protein
MEMRKLIVLLLFSPILFACSKKENIQQTPENADIPLINKILINGTIYKEYAYNEVNLLSEEKSKFQYEKHNYNDRNQVITSDFYFDISMASSSSAVIEAAMQRTEWVNPGNTSKSLTQTFVYNDQGQVIRKNYLRTSDPNPDYSEFTYENDKITRITGYYKNVVRGYRVFSYDTKGNVITQLQYMVSDEGISQLAATTDYEYDSKFNPFRAFGRLLEPGIYTNLNNIVKETYTLNSPVQSIVENVQVTNNTYEYNLIGYPVRVNGSTEYVYR